MVWYKIDKLKHINCISFFWKFSKRVEKEGYLPRINKQIQRGSIIQTAVWRLLLHMTQTIAAHAAKCRLWTHHIAISKITLSFHCNFYQLQIIHSGLLHQTNQPWFVYHIQIMHLISWNPGTIPTINWWHVSMEIHTQVLRY